MKKELICIFFTNLFVLSFFAQDELPESNEVTPPQSLAIRLGLDLAKPIITAINNESEISYELVADVQYSKKWFAALEFGFAQKDNEENLLNFLTKGVYSKVGFNYNVFENLNGMNNEVLIGARYGFSNFESTLNSFTINSNDNYFDNSPNIADQTYDDLSAHWLEFMGGIKVEMLKNLFLGTSISLNVLLSDKDPENFLIMHVPGFNRLYSNKLGIGFNYTLSYKIPIFKR